MQGMSDKEFDEFFKKKVENYDIPYNPKAWNGMRAKLDKTEGVGGNNIRKFITGLALLILLGAGSFWYVGISQTSSSQEITSQNTPASAQADEQEVISEPSPQKQTAYIADAEVAGKPSSVSSDKDRVQKTVPAGGVTTNTRKVTSSASEKESRLAAFLEEQQDLPIDEEMAYHHGNLSYLPYQLWASLPVSWISDSISIKKVAVNQEALHSAENPGESKKENSIIPHQSPFYRLGLSLTVSPDMSAIGLKQISQVGAKSGIGLEYFLFRNLSLNAGIIFSHKIYSATEGYEFSSGYNNYYSKPSSIDAECNVLDLALNLRYYALNWEKSRIYLSSGLSSYLMLAEEYEYNYDSYYAKTYPSHRVRNENQHYFKVSNFSVGYERALGSQWTLQAEPFVKIPLAGVGEGKVKLSTAGMFVTLNYRFGLTRLSKK